MSGLLEIVSSEQTEAIARSIYQYQMEQDETLKTLSGQAKERMYEDVLSNLSFLDTAWQLKDRKLFPEYACWCFHLLINRMNYFSKEKIAQIMLVHYRSIYNVLPRYYETEQCQFLQEQLEEAIRLTGQLSPDDWSCRDGRPSCCETHVQEYLDYLLNSDLEGAVRKLRSLQSDGYEISDIYVDVVQEAMHRVGDLWLENKITVDTEHCCTSITQVAEVQFYSDIFKDMHKEKTILLTCVGQDLHELGARMVSDVLSSNGYQCRYLGTKISEDAILHELEQFWPDMICFSVTMPQFLLNCQSIIKRVRATFPHTRIAVGGRAFSLTEAWKEWDIDVYTKDARELLKWTDTNL